MRELGQPSGEGTAQTECKQAASWEVGWLLAISTPGLASLLVSSQVWTALASHILPSFYQISGICLDHLSRGYICSYQSYPNSLNKVGLGIVMSPDHQWGW